jgi:2-polyprenyl-3-methyl-5-hydroxy-6-metoxy-1,4-benzoquinol methylase
VYQNPQPVFEDLRSRYGELYFQYEFENELNFFKLMILGLKDISFFDYPLDFFENTRFLDVGCATGMLIQRMKSLGWEAEGVEICRESAEYGIEKRNADIFVGTLEEAGFPDESFSVVHFSHLIEHVPDPARFLEEVFRILTKRGFAIVTTPNVAGFQAWLFKNEWRSAIADHLTLFSAATLRKMLAKTGFKVLKSVTWGGLAKGAAPTFVKRPADYLAKKLGFGDVVLFFVQK